MDSATARRMTKFGGGGYFGDDGRGAPLPCQRRYPSSHIPLPYQRRYPPFAYTVALPTPLSALRIRRRLTNAVIRLCIHRCLTNAVIRPSHTPSAYQHRHTARSRSIHGGVQRTLDFLGGALAGGDGFCDCAQNDEVWGAEGTSGMTGGGRRCPANTVIRLRIRRRLTNAVIRLRIHRCLTNAVIRLCIRRRLTNTVILREVAVSMVVCRGRWVFWVVRWQGEMDSATARRMTKFGGAVGTLGMTKFGGGGYFGDDGRGAPLPCQRRYPPSHTPLPYQRRYPSSHTPLPCQRRYPPSHTPLPYQRRHTARSRSIHGGVQRALGFLGGALAGGDGFCDCAQNDEVCAQNDEVWVQRVLRE